MVTGGLAASYFGRPRTTVDLDLVVRTRPEDFLKLAGILRRVGVRISRRKLESAWSSGYRIVACPDSRSPHSLDIILSEEPLQRMRGSLLEMDVFYQKPMELILAKLRMIGSTEDPERRAIDKADILGILASRRINVRALMGNAKRQSTAAILREMLQGRGRRREHRKPQPPRPK